MINTVGLLLNKQDYIVPKGITPEEWINNIRSVRNSKGYWPNIEVCPDKTTIKVECSPAKLLYANNIEEVARKDLPKFLVTLQRKLNAMLIITCPAVLAYAHEYRLDVAKLVYIDRTSEEVSECLSQRIPTGQNKKAITLYTEQGVMIADCLKNRKFAFYNKSAEALKDKMLPKALKQQIQQLNGTLWRMELSMKKAQEIRREHANNKIPCDECTLMTLFDERRAEELLKARFAAFSSHILQPNDALRTCALFHSPRPARQTTASLSAPVKRWLRQQRTLRSNKEIIYNMAGILVTSILGTDRVRRIIKEVKNAKQANRFIADIRQIMNKHTSCWKDICKAFNDGLKTMKPFTRNELKLLPKRKIAGKFSVFNAPILLAIAKHHLTAIYNYSLKMCPSC